MYYAATLRILVYKLSGPETAKTITDHFELLAVLAMCFIALCPY